MKDPIIIDLLTAAGFVISGRSEALVWLLRRQTPLPWPC